MAARANAIARHDAHILDETQVLAGDHVPNPSSNFVKPKASSPKNR
jgi:hypothetical protein